jgi:hypothetical protein
MENNKQKTAVDWIVEKMLTQDWYTYKSLEYIKQAKEMEKKQIILSIAKNLPIEDGVITAVQKGEKYYNETYGDNK